MDATRIFFRIGDVARLLDLKPSVLRFWETEFAILAPEKAENGQRVYRRGDVETLFLIQSLLYDEGYSIEGARKRLRELRRTGQLKSSREAIAIQRGFRPEPSAPRFAAAAESAGRQVPLEAVIPGAFASAEPPAPGEGELEVGIGLVIAEVRALRSALRRAPG